MSGPGEMLIRAAGVAPLAASLLVTALWQGVLLTVGVALALRCFPGLSARTRTRVWAATVALIFALPVLPMLLVRRAAGNSAAEVHVGATWSVGLLVFWAGLSLCQAARLGLNAWRVRGVIRRSERLLAEGGQLPIRVSAEIGRPSLAGLLRPCVLLPAGLAETLSPAELRHVLLHEQEHLRRGDPWLNLLQQASLLLLPMHPALHWLNRRLCRDRELACDEGVLQAIEARHDYAACLVKLAEDSMLRRGVQCALGLLGSRARQSELVLRVQRILDEPVRMPGGPRRLAVASLSGAMLLAAVAFARAPQLMSFDAQVPMLHADAQPSSGVSAAMLPTSMPESGAMPAAVLTRAVMNAGVAPIARAASLQPRAPRRAAVLRRVSRMHATSARQHLVTGNVRALRAAGVVVPQTAPRLTRVMMTDTDAEFVQPVYAAVRWRDGWLIVQL